MFVTVLQRLLQIFFLSGDTHVHFVGTCGLRSLATVLKALVTPGLFRRLSSTLPMLPLLLFSVTCPEEFSSYIFVLFYLHACIQSRACRQALVFLGFFFLFSGLETDPGPGSGPGQQPGSCPSSTSSCFGSSL